MCPVVRISTETYSRLEKHAIGFDTPANVIERILDHYEGVEPSPGVKTTQSEAESKLVGRKMRLYTNKEIQLKISKAAERLPLEELESFCQKAKSTAVFGISFPLFVKLPATANQMSKRAAVKTEDDVNRWTWKYEFERNGYVYAVCTQWYPKNDALVQEWLEQYSERWNI